MLRIGFVVIMALVINASAQPPELQRERFNRPIGTVPASSQPSNFRNFGASGRLAGGWTEINLEERNDQFNDVQDVTSWAVGQINAQRSSGTSGGSGEAGAGEPLKLVQLRQAYTQVVAGKKYRVLATVEKSQSRSQCNHSIIVWQQPSGERTLVSDAEVSDEFRFQSLPAGRGGHSASAIAIGGPVGRFARPTPQPFGIQAVPAFVRRAQQQPQPGGAPGGAAGDATLDGFTKEPAFGVPQDPTAKAPLL